MARRLCCTSSVGTETARCQVLSWLRTPKGIWTAQLTRVEHPADGELCFSLVRAAKKPSCIALPDRRTEGETERILMRASYGMQQVTFMASPMPVVMTAAVSYTRSTPQAERRSCTAS